MAYRIDFTEANGWSLTTGGECRLAYRFTFDFGDKAEQTKGLEELLINAVTSVVRVVDNKVEVSGVKHENLLNLNALDIVLKFSSPTASAAGDDPITLTKMSELARKI